MKLIFKPGDKKVYTKIVNNSDLAAFHGEMLHEVCSTFSIARDFEWTSRLFFIEMKEDDEEGVGTSLTIDHISPAFINDEITFTATIKKIEKNELTCGIEALVNNQLIATGSTGQKMLKKEKLKQRFTKPTS